MNPFTIHPHRRGITYCEHWCFAALISVRLLITALAFAFHAMLPFIPIRPRLNLESTAAYLQRRNRWIEAAEGQFHRGARSDFVVSSRPHVAKPVGGSS